MRNNSLPRMIAVALMTCVCSVANGVTLPSSLQARYTELIAVIKKCDFKAFDAFYSSDFVAVDPAGKTSNRADYMAGIQEMVKDAKKMAFTVTYTGVKTHDGVVDVSVDCTGQIFKPEGTSTFHEVGIESWKKVGKVWMEIKTVDKVFDWIAPKSATQ